MKTRLLLAAAAVGGLVVGSSTAAQQPPRVATAPAFHSWSHKVAAAETTWPLVAQAIAAETASGVLTAAQASEFGQALRRATDTQPSTPHRGQVIDYDPADIPIPAVAPVATMTPSTTVPATTTTTLPATTTTAPATTTPSAARVRFSASFDTPADFYDRFDRGLSGAHPTVDPNHIQQWDGDHDAACGLPDTRRTVHLGPDRQNIDEMFWWCAPAGAETGHVMTSLNTLGYNSLWFSPKPWFTDVTRVCWDQNTSFLGGRKWTQMTISTRAEVERVQRQQGNLDLGFSHPGFQTIGGPTTGIIPTDETVGVNYFIGFMTLWQGDHEIGQVGSLWKNEDVVKRYTLCAVDNGDNTITMTEGRPGGQARTATYAGAFPDGDVRVAFHDANYDPPKDGEYDASQNTWHWDNIVIEAG